MSDFNADSDPDVSKGGMIAHQYRFFSRQDTKFDQFSTAGSFKVYKFAKRIGSNHLQVLVDPALIPA